jgi:hypothetical protein
VRGDKVLEEKLGRKDPCPCGSGKSFQEVLLEQWTLLTGASEIITSGIEIGLPLGCQKAGKKVGKFVEGVDLSRSVSWFRPLPPAPAAAAG